MTWNCITRLSVRPGLFCRHAKVTHNTIGVYFIKKKCILFNSVMFYTPIMLKLTVECSRFWAHRWILIAYWFYNEVYVCIFLKFIRYSVFFLSCLKTLFAKEKMFQSSTSREIFSRKFRTFITLVSKKSLLKIIFTQSEQMFKFNEFKFNKSITVSYSPTQWRGILNTYCCTPERSIFMFFVFKTLHFRFHILTC